MTSAFVTVLAAAIAALLVGLAIGLAVAFRLSQRLSEVRSQVVGSTAEYESARRDATRLSAESAEWRKKCEVGSAENANLGALVAGMERQLEAAEQRQVDLEQNLPAKFRSVADDALKDNNDAFLTLATVHLTAHTTKADGDLEARENAVEALLRPVKETLTKLEVQTRAIESERIAAYSGVHQMVNSINAAYLELRGETKQLVTALRSPNARGNWGELQLKRCVEFAGMIEHCTFKQQQKTVTAEGDEQKPDLIVQLPNGRQIVVDAKTPFDAYLDSLIATDETIRAAKLAAYAERVRVHIKQLSSKEYSKQFPNAPDFVVCFLSSEVFFSAALEQDPSLIERGARANVVLATPTTLIALLKAIAYGWQQVEITKNAIAIRDTGEALYNKMLGVQSYLTKMGKTIKGTVEQYNALITALEGQGSVFSKVRNLHKLGVGKNEAPETETLDATVRPMTAEDWDTQAPLFLPGEADDTSGLAEEEPSDRFSA